MRYVLLLLVWITPAHAKQAVFYSYSAWEQLSESERLAYIAGAFDTVSIIATPEQGPEASHFNQCIVRSGMDLLQLDANVRAHVRTRPGLQAGPMPAALMQYLTALCGLPPKQ